MAEHKKGFTLAEVLIVIAIIAVLVAVSVPIFTNQLEKAREAVDLSNVRSAYSIVQTSIMTGNAPDGKGEPEDNSIYFYTNSGTFQRVNYGGSNDIPTAYKLKSNGVELPDFIDINTIWGWKGCAIMVTYTNGVPNMYTNPL